MENTIPSKSIFNRKIIFEIRFKAKPAFVDKRGEILNKLLDNKTTSTRNWDIGHGDLKLRDNEIPEESRTNIFVDPSRITLLCSSIASNESYYHLVETAYKIVKEILGEFNIIRIGCRVIGTYKAKNSDFNQIVSGFKNLFPSQILLEDFNVKDLRLQLVYQNGMYQIGPINKNDDFVNKEFNYEGQVKGIGFAIDTDNYILKSIESDKINETSIRDVFMTSLSVEKSLFDKLNTL